MASDYGFTIGTNSATYRSISFRVILSDDHITSSSSGDTFNYICLVVSEGSGSVWDNVYAGTLAYKGPWTRCAPDVTVSSGVVTGLTPGKTYRYGFIANNLGTDTWGTGGIAIATTHPIPPIPTKWSWSASNGDATAEQTIAAYNAVINHGLMTDFSYLVWNDLVNKVVEINRGYAVFDYTVNTTPDVYWDDEIGYVIYSRTLCTDSSKTLTAGRFNSLRHQIDLHYSTGIAAVSTGDVVYGCYFIALADCINAWIDQL